MGTPASYQATGQVVLTKRPRFSGMSHVSLPCGNLEDSKIFYADVMGGTLVHEIQGFVEYRIEDIIIGLSEQPEGWIDFGCLNYRWNGKGTGGGAANSLQPPRFKAFAHFSIYCPDLQQAKRFFTSVIGGELIHDVKDSTTGFAEVRVAGIVIGFTDRPGKATGRNAEYPHYAFFVEPEDFLPMVAWLRHNGVTTSEPWTRDGIKGLLYFREPAGNLFEMYCPKLVAAASFVRGAKRGGSYAIDFAGLNYDWKG